MKTKTVLICGIAILSILPIGILSCSQPEESAMPPLEKPSAPDIIEVSCDEFMTEKHITMEVEITHPSSQIVTLCSNPTTGFQWTESASISEESVIYQYEHNFVPPDEEGVVGAPGKDVWTFKTLKKGTSTVSLEYSRPWEGGEQGEWTFTLVITVK